MINAEKFRKELLELSNQNIAFAVRRENQNAVVRCDSIKRCTDCLFGRGRCSVNSTKWLLSEYKEPIKLSRLEYEILKHVQKEGFNFITRNNCGNSIIHEIKPIKHDGSIGWCTTSKSYMLYAFNGLFKFVTSEDEEPRAIKDILENCVVVEDESK